jgi:hypothetical protein
MRPSAMMLAGRVAVHWGQPATTGPGQGRHPWLVHPGGFTLDEPQCVNLVVEAGGEKQTVVSIGWRRLSVAGEPLGWAGSATGRLSSGSKG